MGSKRKQGKIQRNNGYFLPLAPFYCSPQHTVALPVNQPSQHAVTQDVPSPANIKFKVSGFWWKTFRMRQP